MRANGRLFARNVWYLLRVKSHCHFHIHNVSSERVYYSFAYDLLWFAANMLSYSVLDEAHQG